MSRTWDSSNKSKWKLDGEAKSEKDIKRFVAGLNIQTDNLCQFLPQDRVHEFSRMSPKALLHRTVDAVGEDQLRSDHARLTEMQSAAVESREVCARRRRKLDDNRAHKDRLEADVKSFKEKKELEEMISLVDKRMAWALLVERRKQVG